MKKAPKNPKNLPEIPVYNIRFEIKSTEATLDIAGDCHYGMRGIDEDEVVYEYTRHKKDTFKVFTGDMGEFSLKTSVGHNYDIAVPDPEEQKEGVKRILTRTMQHQLGGIKNWSKYEAPTKNDHENAKAIGVGGNHEYRIRKLAGQWIDKEFYEAAKILSMGIEGIVNLTIFNTKLKLEKTYKIYLAHAPGKTSASSKEAILRGFRKKQMELPGIDIIIFGHFHKRLIDSDGYFDTNNNSFKKTLYVVNPSPLKNIEYAIEAGFVPFEPNYNVQVYLPLDKDLQPYGII